MTDAELQAHYQAAMAARGTSPASGASCPSPEQLLALAERSGDEETRLATLDHIMSCATCHREFALLQAIHAAQPRQTRLMPRQWLAAAGLLIVLAGGALVSRGIMSRPSDDLTRGAAGAGRDQGISVIAPQAAVPAGALQALVWHAVPGAVAYTIEILDDSDRVLFTKQTADTVTPVPPLSGTPTAWWVRATLGDGTDRRSRIVRLAPGR